MATSAAQVTRQSSESPSETRPFEENAGHLDVYDLPSGVVGRAVFKPGWQWSKHVKPIAGTESCQSAHVGYTISGRMRVRMDGGAETEFGAGDFTEIPPGHDAWVVGDEDVVTIDWTGMTDYAKRK